MKIQLMALLILMQSYALFAATPAEVFDRAKDSVLIVKTLNAHGEVEGQGSGVMLPNGFVGTNCHVIKDGHSFLVGRNNVFHKAAIYGGNEEYDICLLSCPDLPTRHVTLGNSKELKVGDPVYAIGAPRGLELSLSNGIVSQLRGGTPPLIQTTAAISPGSSGGGLFNKDGRLVGFTTMYIEGGQNLNFAMPVELLEHINKGEIRTSVGTNQLDQKKHAEYLTDKEDWHKLLDFSKKWAISNPSGEAWFYMGLAYVMQEREGEAVVAFRKAIDNDPNHIAAWSNLGLAHEHLGQYEQALSSYKHAASIAPENGLILYNIGNAYVFLQRHSEAIQPLLKSLELNPNYANGWSTLGAAYANLDRYQEAIDSCRHALDIDSNHAHAWYCMASSWIATGNKTAASNAARRLHKLDPGLAELVLNQLRGK